MSNMVVNTNIFAINSHRSMKNVGTAQGKASARLSSGLRVNSAADDAAGLAISEKMRAQVRGLDMASRNAQDGISVIQTAEGGLQEIQNMGQRIREISVQMANDSNTDDDRALAQKEVAALTAEITRLSTGTKFNTKALYGQSFSFQVGADKDSVQIAIDAVPTTLASASVGNQASAADLIATANSFITSIATNRATLGATQNRLEYTIKSLDVSSENLAAAESRIRDTDMAKEMMNFTKANVLQQAAVSMLSQANQAPQSVLQLLR